MEPGQRKIIVVGAGSGIGAATAAHFHERGDHVLAVDLLLGDTPATRYEQCDLRDASAVAALLGRIGPDWDLLAHVAGVPGTAPDLDVLKVNYLGMRRMVEGMLPRLRRGGAVVTVASTAAIGWQERLADLSGLLDADNDEMLESWWATQDPTYPAYVTSKQAAVIYTKRLTSTAWQKYGVRLNTVSPGPTLTPILPDFETAFGKGAMDHLATTVGRHATVEDIVPAIAFLGSPEARWIAGQDLQVDGGFMGSMSAGPPITA
ncbi:SDR family oxidoreductase [Nocardia sp. NPDC055165]